MLINPLSDILRELDWTSPAEVYHLLVPLVATPEYRYELLTGLITSAGSRTESLVSIAAWLQKSTLQALSDTSQLRHSSQCLSEYINQLPTMEGDTTVNLQDVVREFNSILENYFHDDRVSIALLEVIGILFESGTLSRVGDEAL
jgi:hypothetical protein